MLWSFVTTLCSPNEDFGRPNESSGTSFRRTFQRFLPQIEYSRPWKVLRKCVPDGSFGLPKSSFGSHKLCKMINTFGEHAIGIHFRALTCPSSCFCCYRLFLSGFPDCRILRGPHVASSQPAGAPLAAAWVLDLGHKTLKSDSSTPWKRHTWVLMLGQFGTMTLIQVCNFPQIGVLTYGMFHR
jgi:hypothetical protein